MRNENNSVFVEGVNIQETEQGIAYAAKLTPEEVAFIEDVVVPDCGELPPMQLSTEETVAIEENTEGNDMYDPGDPTPIKKELSPEVLKEIDLWQKTVERYEAIKRVVLGIKQGINCEGNPELDVPVCEHVAEKGKHEACKTCPFASVLNIPELQGDAVWPEVQGDLDELEKMVQEGIDGSNNQIKLLRGEA